jgi:hypothetical protein
VSCTCGLLRALDFDAGGLLTFLGMGHLATWDKSGSPAMQPSRPARVKLARRESGRPLPPHPAPAG